jgi:pimeloyl-ACP methyl ester carboxylesterase
MEPRFERRGDSRELAVLVHGLGSSRLVKDVKETLAECLPDADLMVPRFRSTLFSNADPSDLAAQLSDLIEAAEQNQPRGGYTRIILVGHSFGALLARKAYVFACGENHELRRGGLIPGTKSWAKKVERIILLAGMNRGWSVTPKPRHRSWAKSCLYWAGETIAWLTRTGYLLRSLRRGSPFIANLRVQWISLARQGGMLPTTIQLLGDIDDVVSDTDNIDLQSGAQFIYLKVPNTGHETVVQFQGAAGEYRKQKFCEALLTGIEELKTEYTIPDKQKPNPDVEQVVFIMHGIRDLGDWTDRLAAHIRERAQAIHRKVATVTSGYGYFPMGKFLLVGERQKNVRWFMDQYTEALAKYPNARLEFVGHSNGTYLLASALTHYQACSFDRAVFAGTVVRRDFDWDQMVADGRISALRSYVATADWVVGIFPHVFEYLPKALRSADIGSGGFLGFEKFEAKRNEVRFIAGAHSAALCGNNFGPIAQFILSGDGGELPAQLKRSEQARAVLLMAKLCWLIWFALIGVLVLGLEATVSYGPSAGIFSPVWVRVLLYVILVIAVLNTI